MQFTLTVNGEERRVDVDPETPLLYILRNDLGLKGPKYGCGEELCGACKVLVDGVAVQSCKLPVETIKEVPITTVEGLGSAAALHPLQEAFLYEQAVQCGYCAAGLIVAAQGLLNRVRYPTDADINEALADNLCRCGVHERVRRAIKLRIGRPSWDPIYTVERTEPLPAGETPLPAALERHPDLDAWVRINEDETITVFSGKVEIGQGLKTAIGQIAAEELSVKRERVEVVMGDTTQTPDEGFTVGSMSLETSGNAVRWAAAEARRLLLAQAFEALEAQTPAQALSVKDGTVTDPATGRSTSYWQLMGGKSFGRLVGTRPPFKDPANHEIVGEPEMRVDLLPKVTGGAIFVHDLDLPGMVHARVVRPPAYRARLTAVDTTAVEALDGVIKVLVDGSFLAVVAEREEQAIWAMEGLRAAARWDTPAELPDEAALYDDMRRQTANSFLIVDGTPVDAAIPPKMVPKNAARTLSATYARPFVMHGSIGPSAAVAHLDAGRMTIWSHTQGVYPMRASIAQVLKMPLADVDVIHWQGAGCYGHNGADDVALDAALVARALPGRPVSLKWMRADEHLWEPYGAAMLVDLKASLDEAGGICAWNQDVWSYTHLDRTVAGGEGSSLLAARHLAEPFPYIRRGPAMGNQVGGHRNANPLYEMIAPQRIVKHFLRDTPLRASSLRALGAYANVLAIESFLDELAFAAGADPVAFRLQHLEDVRARAVIEAAAARAGWEPRAEPAGTGQGRGIAFGRYKNKQTYAAVVVELAADRKTGAIQLQRAIIAADAGQVVNPDGLSNQLEGGVLQSSSWTLKEQVRFDRVHVNSRDWDTYPILRFADAPALETVILNRPEQPFLGSGEATQGPTAAAIANALFDALGVRLREAPFTPPKVLAALRDGATQ